MLVNFHKDPINLDQLCFDLRNDGAAVISTILSNFRSIAKKVDGQMDNSTIHSLSVQDTDLHWHDYLVNLDIVEFDSSGTPNLILKAIEQWKRAGSPFPFTARV